MNKQKNILKNINRPFRDYDYFGHFGPAITYIIAIMIYISIEYDVVGILREAQNNSTIKTIFSAFNYWPISLTLFIFTIVFVYIFGIVISSISGIVIDRIFVKKIYGYPYQVLLYDYNRSVPVPKNKRESLKRRMDIISSSHYKFIFFGSNFSLLWFYTTNYYLNDYEIFFINYRLTPIIIYSVPLLVFLLFVYFYFVKNSAKYQNHDESYIMKWMYGPIVLCTMVYTVFSNLLANYIKVPHDFHKTFKKDFFKLLKKEHPSQPFKKLKDTSDAFWYSYLSVISDKRFTDTIRNYLLQYSFARNLSTALYLGFITIFLYHLSEPPKFSVFILGYLYFAFALIMLVRYYYVYFSYFSKFVFRAYLYKQHTSA
jgi:hypothetical protein